MKQLSVFMLGFLLLAGCGEKVYDAEYYAEHVEQARAVLEKCKKGDVAGKNCDNARQGIGKNMINQFSKSLERMNQQESTSGGQTGKEAVPGQPAQ